jgi:hypothetical protein
MLAPRSTLLRPQLSPFIGTALLALSGCALDVTPAGSETSLAEQANHAAYFQQTWDQGDGVNFYDVAPLNDYWCALTGVAGKFRGLGEEVYIRGYNAHAPTWRLYGKSQQSGVSATATCYTRASFRGVGSSNIVSPEFVHQQTSPEKCGFLGIGDCVWGPPSPSVASVWQGDSVTMLTGMAGDFRTSNELIEVRQASTPAAASELLAQNYIRHERTSRIRAHSFFVGTPGAARPARFFGPGGYGTASVGEFSAGGVAGTQSVRMANRDEALCYLTHLSGSFSGSGTRVQIQPDASGAWTLSVQGTSSSRVRARARCMLLDQRPPAQAPGDVLSQ